MADELPKIPSKSNKKVTFCKGSVGFKKVKEVVPKKHDFFMDLAALGLKRHLEVIEYEALNLKKTSRKIIIKKADVEFLARVTQIPKATAERILKKYQGDVINAFKALTE